MAELGFRTIDEMVGRADRLDMRPALDHWKAAGVDLSQILHQPDVPASAARRRVRAQDHGIDGILDRQIIAAAEPALERREPVTLRFPIRNANRTVGTMLGFEVTKRHGGDGLPDDTIRVHFEGSAGQSFGAFVPSGVTLCLEGDSNDFWGKGLSGGRLIVYPPDASTFRAEDNVIIGNVALYGATSGEAYVRGVAGERFAVRNSGAYAVVEGVGDHGCEYMTGGRVVVLGRTGRNFAAGMSGGIAYVVDDDGLFARRCNRDLVELESLEEDEDLEFVRAMIARHAAHTRSQRAAQLLTAWTSTASRIIKIIPRDYKRVVLAEARARLENREPAFAELVAVARG
jgi:glutamate synthase (ferredoxin)